MELKINTNIPGPGIYIAKDKPGSGAKFKFIKEERRFFTTNDLLGSGSYHKHFCSFWINIIALLINSFLT